jgi:glycosyltransferase involved in cell wall biosynthesis
MNSANPTIEDYLKAPAHPLRQTGGMRSVKPVSSPDLPLVTIVTIVRNRKDTLPQTIRAVLTQTYPNIEYIIVDGASTDGTLEVIKQFDDKIDLWISEPDRGGPDALNKALSLAHGSIVFSLSSDDWINPDFMEIAVQALQKANLDFVFGNVALYELDGRLDFVSMGNADYAKYILHRPPRTSNTSMVIRRRCYERVGLIDISFKNGADYEWLLRLHLSGGKGAYEKRLTVSMRKGGVSDTWYFINALEELKALKKHHLPQVKYIFFAFYVGTRRAIRHVAKFLMPDPLFRRFVGMVRRSYSIRQD